MSVSIEIAGVESLMARLDPVQVQGAIDSTLRELGPLVQRAAQVYPPELPNQQYRRTGDLRRSWRQRRSAPTELHVESVNVGYAPWVMDATQQARIHRGRWQTDSMIADQHRPIAIRILTERLEAALG